MLSGASISHAAFTWDSLTYQIDGGASLTILETDSPWDGAGSDFGSLGSGSLFTGTFDAETSGDITTVNFSYSVTGGILLSPVDRPTAGSSNQLKNKDATGSTQITVRET